MNQVTFTIDATDENVETINSITAIIAGGKPATAKTEKPVMKTKGTAKPAKTDTPVETETPATEEANDNMSLADFKKAASKCKKAHGEDFTMQVIKDANIKVGTTLGRTISKISDDNYVSIVELWEAGPTADETNDDDNLDDDDDGLDDNTPKVKPEAVKLALKAYGRNTGRTEAKALMSEHGCDTLSDVDELSAEKLGSIMKALT
ncbi:MAG: hypothetical protein DRP42_05010 [Tenericutes bacterium]|nr:MAG: hypothetical protein DRP42_05010 [Mycoplasmatota bacterium]